MCFVLLVAGTVLCARWSAFALGTSKPLKQYGRQSWQSDTGLPQNTVHAVVQTKDGFLWMGTEGGLVRFDGQEFRTFDSGNTHELPSDSIDGLAVDAEGTLWISCSGGLVHRKDGRFRLMTTADGLPSNAVRFVRARRGGGILVQTADGIALGGPEGFHSPGLGGDASPELIAERPDGGLWIGSGGKLSQIDADATGGAVIAATFDVGEMQAIAAGANGELWIGGRSGLAAFRGGHRVPVGGRDGAALNVSTLLAMPNGDLWVGTDSGLFEYTRGVIKRVSDKSGVTAGRVLRLFADREGAVWAAFDLGVARVIRNDPGVLQAPIDVAGVLSIFEDREGDMWFGSDVGGVTSLREQAFSTWTTQDGLSDDFVRAVFQDHAGTVWLGTNRGGLDRIAAGKVSALRAGSGGLSSNVVLSLAESGGDLWIGTPDGLSRLHNGDLKLFTTADGLPDDFVRSLYTDTDGSLWIGTRNGLSHYTGDGAHGVFTSYSKMDGLGSDLIGSILRTRDGALWVGTLNGLSRFDGKGFRNFTTRDGLGGDAITALAEDHEGALWIAAHAAGLTRLRGGVFTAIASAKIGLPEEIYSVLESTDGQSGLWLGSPKGVYRVSLDGLNAYADKGSTSVPVQVYGVADGMKISECSSGGHPAAWRMNDGSLWFATLKGAASISPDSGYENRVAPLTAIEQVSIDDRPVEDASGAALVVPPGRERITIHYAGLSFQAPQKVRFRYMLEGFDRGWVDAGTRRTAFYTNVPAGTYRFVVYASNNDGVWSLVPGELRFTVRPHFYQTIWFYCLAVLLGLGIAYVIYRSRVRLVEVQYQAVLAERNRIAREIHDTLAQGYVGISVQLEVASRLLQGASHEGARDAAVQQLESTKELVRSSLAEARSSIWNLRSPGADSDTLPARLAATVRSRQQGVAGGPALRFEVHGSFRPLERRVEDEILRIGQEAVSNAVRHASAGTIVVVLSYDTSWLKLTVTDDGRGFEPVANGNGLSGHYGLQGMRERAANIGARLRVDSRPGSGTTVDVTCDLAGMGSLAKGREER